jgi:hypothetical protein
MADVEDGYKAEESPLECRFYEDQYPEVESLVMVSVKQIADMGAYVALLEYGNIEGMILLSELSRRRIRSINKLIRVVTAAATTVLSCPVSWRGMSFPLPITQPVLSSARKCPLTFDMLWGFLQARVPAVLRAAGVSSSCRQHQQPRNLLPLLHVLLCTAKKVFTYSGRDCAGSARGVPVSSRPSQYEILSPRT